MAEMNDMGLCASRRVGVLSLQAINDLLNIFKAELP